jgi:hypothetical protein
MERVCSRLRLRTRCRFWLETPLSVGASRLTKGAAHVAFNQTQVRAAAKVQKDCLECDRQCSSLVLVLNLLDALSIKIQCYRVMYSQKRHLPEVRMPVGSVPPAAAPTKVGSLPRLPHNAGITLHPAR